MNSAARLISLIAVFSIAFTASADSNRDYTNAQGAGFTGDGLSSWIDGKPYTQWHNSGEKANWAFERQRREQAIKNYLYETDPELSAEWKFRQEGDDPQSPALAWRWFQDSPVGFGGVPFVLLKTVLDLNVFNCHIQGEYDLCELIGIWQKSPLLSKGLSPATRNLDHLGFGPHPEDYDAEGKALPPQQRQWPLPYGFVFQSGDPSQLTGSDYKQPFLQSLESLDTSTYVAGIIESKQVARVRLNKDGSTRPVQDQIAELDQLLQRKKQWSKVSLGLAKLKGSFAKYDLFNRSPSPGSKKFAGTNDQDSVLARYYDDNYTNYGKSTGLDRVFFSCAACHVGRVQVEGRGMVHMVGAPNTEVQAQYFSELLMVTGAAFISSGFDIEKTDTVDPEDFKIRKDLIFGLYKAMLSKAINKPETFYGASQEQVLRAKFMALRLAWNFPEIIKDLIGTAVKTHYVYKVVAGNNGFNPHNTRYKKSDGTYQQVPELINHRIGQMDAFGIASGLVSIHTLRKDKSFIKFIYDDPLNMFGDNKPGQSSVFRGFTDFPQTNSSSVGLGKDLSDLSYDEQITQAGERVRDQQNISAWAPPLAAPVDVKSMYFSRDRALANWDGNQAASARALASGTSATGDPAKVNVQIHEPLNPFINHLPPAPWPWDIDLAKAVEGRKIFQQRCDVCHTPGAPGAPKIYSVKTLKVDKARSLTNTQVSREMLAALVLESCNIYYQNNKGKPGAGFCLPVGENPEERFEDYFSDVPSRVNENKNGYKADMLHGIWSRAPYLHNGSVPTLAALLCSKARPQQFLRGNVHYDTDMVGFEWVEKPANRYNSIHDVVALGTYDTRVASRSNTGHTFTDNLCPDNLDQLDPVKDRVEMMQRILGSKRDSDIAHLLEYLKTL
ncbi:MAG: mono/diheme cytochrome c family protein [Parasphingorhabdus sp.]